jgi:2-keto-3-deoxy-L-rhamnonate aldolase RhmA
MPLREVIRRNHITAAMQAGRLAYGFHMNFAAPSLIEQLGNLPFDFVYLDAEHGSFDIDETVQSCMAAELCDLTVVCRVPTLDANLISKALNAGVQGVIVPHVSTRAEAEAAVDACFMEPLGHRPNGGSRSNRYWHSVDDLDLAMREVNANTLVGVQLESAQSIKNLDEILTVKGIGFFIIGKNDLSQSLGFPRLNKGFHPRVNEVVATMEAKIRAAGGLMKDDVFKAERVKNFAMQGARQFLEQPHG